VDVIKIGIVAVSIFGFDKKFTECFNGKVLEEKKEKEKKEKVCFCPNFLKASQRPTINLMKTHRTQKLFLN